MAFDFTKIFSELAPIAKEVFKSFASKGTLDNVTWLAQTLAKNKDTAKEAAQLTQDIYDTVNRFSANMRAIEQAKSKEQWLKNFIENSNLTEQQKSEYLSQAAMALSTGNQMMNVVMQSPMVADLNQVSAQLMEQDLPAGNASLNRYERAPLAEQVGQQAGPYGHKRYAVSCRNARCSRRRTFPRGHNRRKARQYS